MATANFLINREYKDVSLTFARNPVTRDLVAVVGEEAIKRSVRNLLQTYTGEAPFFPNFGTRLQELLFENIDPITTKLIEDEILSTLKTYEPRVRVQSLSVRAVPDNHQYEVNLVFQILNDPKPVTLRIFLSRLR